MVEVVVVHVLTSVLDRNALERFANGDELSPLNRRQVADNQLATRPRLQKSLLAKRMQRVPDRSFRHSERLGDRSFAEDGAGRQPLSEYLRAHLVIRVFRQPAGSCGLEPRIHRASVGMAGSRRGLPGFSCSQQATRRPPPFATS